MATVPGLPVVTEDDEGGRVTVAAEPLREDRAQPHLHGLRVPHRGMATVPALPKTALAPAHGCAAKLYTMDYWVYVQESVLLLGATMLLGALFERLRQSAILGYLLAGCVLGPGALNLISGESVLYVVAEIGVALLLFTIGL